MVARVGASLAAEEQGIAKPRGRGRTTVNNKPLDKYNKATNAGCEVEN